MVDGGTFDFGAHADRFPGFVEPDPSYGGLRYWPALGPGAFAAKLRVQLLRDTGPAISPFTSYLLQPVIGDHANAGQLVNQHGGVPKQEELNRLLLLTEDGDRS